MFSDNQNDWPFLTYECNLTGVWDKGIEPPTCEKLTCQSIKPVRSFIYLVTKEFNLFFLN